MDICQLPQLKRPDDVYVLTEEVADAGKKAFVSLTYFILSIKCITNCVTTCLVVIGKKKRDDNEAESGKNDCKSVVTYP